MLTRRHTLKLAVAGLALAAAVPAFAQDWKAKYPELVFAIIPSENASGVVERYTPFVNYLAKELGTKVTLRIANDYAAIIEGAGKGIFTVRRSGDFDITDGTFLPNCDLLLLERSFSMGSGVKMRLRRLLGPSIAKGQVADGPILFEADMGYQIDNMEGMDVWRRTDGALMVSLMSDDNHSILQRNLYLEFILHED